MAHNLEHMQSFVLIKLYEKVDHVVELYEIQGNEVWRICPL